MSTYKDENTKHTLRDIIRDPNKKVDEASNELAFIFRTILSEHRLSIDQWDNLTTRYYIARYGGDTKTVAQEKINLIRAVAKEQLTWGRFMEAIEVLGYDECEISITLKNSGDKASERTHTARKKNKYKRIAQRRSL